MITPIVRKKETTREIIQIGLRFLENNDVASTYDRGTVVIHRSTSSTMDEVDRLIDPAKFRANPQRFGDKFLLSGFPPSHGTTIIALCQKNGRGSTDITTGNIREWWSGAGNLMMSRVVNAGGHANEIEFVAGLAVAEIIADLLPRAVVTLKYPNDILVNGEKISGCLVENKYEARSGNAASQNINLGVGVNIAAAPDTGKMRDGSEVKATCLHDHGIEIGIAELVSRFETRFEELLNYRNQHGFTAILQRIGFADTEGLITLYSREGNTFICGAYRGYSATEGNPAIYLHLEGQEPILSQNYTGQARIKGSRMMSSPRPALAAEELNAA